MPVQLISLIKPKTSGGGLGQFPMVEDVDFLGGFQVRADATDRDSIYALNRKEGMHVYVISLNKTYRLDADLLSWTEVTGGGSSTLDMRQEDFPAATFTSSPPLSTKTIAATPSSDGGLLHMRTLWRNGVEQPKMVSGVPAAAWEWRLNGTTLEIYGNVLSSGDDFTVRYPV